MKKIYTYGENFFCVIGDYMGQKIASIYGNACDVYRKGYYYIDNLTNERVNCIVGYMRDEHGKPHGSKVFVREQITDFNTHINAYTQSINAYDFEFENEFEYIYLCEHCIEAIKSRGEYVYIGEEITVWNTGAYYDEKTLSCEWCEDDELLTVYECHF